MTENQMLEIIEGMSDADLAQHLADLVNEVNKFIKSKHFAGLENIQAELQMAHNEWEYRNQ